MLEIRGLTRRFGDLVAVDDVSFTVPAGGLTGFVGGNGAGKTTTMRMAMGVLAHHAGEVRWQGRPVDAADRRRFGYMPEERGLYPKQPILEQLVYLARLRGLQPAAARGEIIELLERFGLGERTKEPLQKLSLGNQQRVQIVAALVPRPDMLILDEPFSGLDPLAIDAMTDLLRERAASGVPVVFSSHQLDLVDQLCDRLVVMARGRVVAEGTADELRAGAPLRYRIRLGADAGWVRELSGLQVVDVSGPEAVLDVLSDGAEQQLLGQAAARGPVHDFSRVVPRLSEIYREVTA
ncbi:ABC transporter ATP-binding protein [Nocardioides sp. Root190]|uniref:ABC transporter ATP-binding protein n=1 Tax=Nocardioides sp. Root190 TaxID=1736488 RepID=UPI0006F3FBE9|nr:ATP-binding cassette domain-containing protein [Nocardioides sp. Root190]KRB76893.1 ABC transporter ATP-binding protein [Nocardioides sp. Root190]